MNKKVSNARKEVLLTAYRQFAKALGFDVKVPKVRREYKIPYVPPEKDIEALIGAMPRRYKVFLLVLKETGARPGEAFSLTVDDIDLKRQIIRITPEKGSEPRIFKISNRLTKLIIDYLHRRPNSSRKLFGDSYRAFYRNYLRYRNKAAEELKMPELKKINFYSLRHFKAIRTYYKTKDLLYVKRILGHRSITNTIKYLKMVEFKEPEYICKIATNVQEAAKLIEAGFEYVATFEGKMLFRKPK